MGQLQTVAPHVGAWIETETVTDIETVTDMSRLTWARGLKHNYFGFNIFVRGVAPHDCGGGDTHINIT